MIHLMTHMIPWFPTRELSMEAAKAMVEGGARYLEIQFPFTDPSADGPSIERACTLALEQGFTLAGGFEFVREIRTWIEQEGFPTQIIIMSYASLVYALGVPSFVAQTRQSGAMGLIIPDLPLESDEGYWQSCAQEGIQAIPVLVPFMKYQRLQKIIDMNPAYVYCALRAGITGTETEIDDSILSFLQSPLLKGRKIFAGFGLSKRSQVDSLAPHVYGLVVGSAMVRIIESQAPGRITSSIKDFVQELCK